MQYSNLVSVSSVKGVAVSQMEELETREIGDWRQAACGL